MGGFTASIKRLLALPAGKRAIQPYSFAYTYWNFNSDKGLTGVSANSEMYSDTGVVGVCANIYGTPWANQGLSLGLCAWNKVLTQIGNSGGKIDYMLADIEAGGMFANWSLQGITGITSAFLRNPNYNQTWNGVTSLALQMSNDGATISNVFPKASGVFDYVVWNKALISLNNALFNKVLWNPTLALHPNIIGSNYQFFDSGTTFDSSPDLHGHPDYRKSIFGNAASPVLYGVIGQLATAWRINPTDTTRILLGATTNPLYTVSRSAWNSFLLDIQTTRCAKRNSPNIPLTPWIAATKYAGVDQAGVSATGAPPVGYADVTSGFNSDIGHTFGSAGNSAYYYEMVRHVSLHGVKAFGYYNAEGSQSGITQRAGLLNTVLTEINNTIGGYRLNTETSARVDWLSKQLTSGTAKSSNNYIWRTTIKPGTIYEHTTTDNTNVVLGGSTVGKWFNTTTSTPPDVRPLELKDVFYFPGVFSTDGSPFAHGTGTSYANWFGTNRSVVAAFQGDLYTSNEATTKVINGRAYEFEMNPANPSVTSPWHNAIYENCIDPYNWGARSFTFFQPHGQIPQVAYPFREVVRRAEGYYNSTTDASKSPARWKGFTSGVRALLEGKLNPAGACAAKTGFTAISEPCNVHVYLPSTNGYWEDRFGNTAAGPAGDTFYPGSLAFWDKCFTDSGGSTIAANNLYYSFVNQWLTEFISMKSPSITAGVLSCSIDATTCSATPNTVGLFATLPAYYTRGNSYELTDWYISQTLRANNIPVYCEARPQKIFKLLNSGITSGEISNIPGLCGATAISQWTNHFSVEYVLWYTDPNNPVLSSPDINFAGAIPNSEVPSVMRYSQNTGPMPNDRDPYQIPIIISTGGTSYLLPFGFPSYNTSPQRALLDLYSASDVYRKFNNLANTGLTFKGVAYDHMTRGMLFTSYGDWARGSCGCKEINPTNNSGSLTGYYRPGTDNASEGNRIGYGGTQPRKFDPTAFIASTTNYDNNSGGLCGYWTPSGISFWRANVKQPTFNGFLEMLKQVSLTGCPPYGNTAGWTAATYPNDFYGLGIIPESMRLLIPFKTFFSDTGSFLGLYSKLEKTLKIYSVNYSTNPITTTLSNTLNLSSIPFSAALNEKCLISDDGKYAIISSPNNNSVYYFDILTNTLLQTITENQPLFGSLIAADKDFYGLSIATTELNRAPTIHDVRSTSWAVSTKIHYYKRNYNSFNTQKFKKVHSSGALGLMKKSGIDTETILAFAPTGFPQVGYGDLQLESSQSLDAGVYRYSDLVCKKYNFASAILGLKQDQINYKSSFFNIDSPRYALLTSPGFTMDSFYGKSNQARMTYLNIQNIIDENDPMPTDAQCISVFTLLNLPAVKQFSISRKLSNNEIVDDKSYQTLHTTPPMAWGRNVAADFIPNTIAGLTYFNENILGSFNEKTFIRGLLGLRLNLEGSATPQNVRPIIDEQVLNTKITINDTHTYNISQILTSNSIKNIRIYRFLNTATNSAETYEFQDYIKPDKNTLSQPSPAINTVGMIKIMYASSNATALENTFFNNSTMTGNQKALFGVVASKPFLANPINCASSEFAFPIDPTILDDTIINIFASNDFVFVNFITTTLIFKIDNSLSYKPLTFQGTIFSLRNHNFTYNSSGEIFSINNEIYKYNSTTNGLSLLKTIN